MNNHLLPFPYNQSEPRPWLDRVLLPLFHTISPGRQRSSIHDITTSISLLSPQDQGPSPRSIRIVCISDTHNATPQLPRGDILIHAGDLTAKGTFAEVQSQLDWLDSQPHTHKLVIAGNHDIILDPACDAKFVARGEDSASLRPTLNWGDVRYLQDDTIVLEFESPGNGEARTLKIYGSPMTPEFGSWAFQYPAIRDVWTRKVPEDVDVLVTHGPPALYGDCDGEMDSNSKQVKVKGDGYLLKEIRRVKPTLMVCGHIHGAFGTSEIEHEGSQEVCDVVQMGWQGASTLGFIKSSIWERFYGKNKSGPKTLVVNAAFAPGAGRTDVKKQAIIVDL